MSNYVKWTTTFLLCIACVFPHKVKSDGNNVATLRTFVKKEMSDKFVNPNLINKDSLGSTQSATNFTCSPKRSHIDDDDKQRINSENSFGNVIGSANDYITLFEKTNSQQLPRKRKKRIKNILTGIYTPEKNPDYSTEGSRDDNLSRIRDSNVFHAKEVKIGDSCKISSQCSSGSICINDTCVCRKEYIMEGLNCVKRNLGSCEEFITCPENSECVNGFCVCRDDYVKRDQECVLETYNGCYNDNDCLEYWKNTVCINKDDGNKCQCQTGYVIGINECLPKRNNGESCQFISQCPWTSLCKNGICVCRDIFTTKDNKCVKREVGDPCEMSYQCPADSECDGGFCICRDYYTAERGVCVESKLGNPCKRTKDCPKWDYLCHKGICICNHGYEERNNTCVPKIVRGPCQSSQYCPENSICKAGTCVCKSAYVERDLKCVSASSDTPDYVWAIIVASIGIFIISLAAAILVVRGRTRAKRNALHQIVPTVSSVVESKYSRSILRKNTHKFR